MWRGWDELFQKVGSLNMNLHIIPQTLHEFKTANPVFLDEVLTHGKVLFSKIPFEAFPKPLRLKHSCLIIYDMSHLTYREKMRVLYFLYKKRGVGAVAEVGD